MEHLRIYDKNLNSAHGFGLCEILDMLGDRCHDCVIKLDYNDDVVLKTGDDPYQLLVELGAHEVKQGHYLMTCTSLAKFFQEIYQVIYIVIVCMQSRSVPLLDISITTVDLGETLSVIQIPEGSTEIRVVDSTYYEVLSRDDTFLEKVFSSFQNIEVVGR